jgi:glutamate/aspartate transport system permease protein
MGNWDWQVFLQDPGGDYPTYLAVDAVGLGLDGVRGAAGAGRGAGAGLARSASSARCPTARGWCGFGNAWVELFRNIPLLVQIFLWYHVIPALIPVMKGVPSFILVVLALGFFTSARIAEQVRSGIQALPKGQRYAGMAVGFTTVQYYRYVILPMAYRIIIPPLTSETMNIFKNSSVAFAVSVTELTMFAMQAQEETSRGIEVYLAVTGLYAVSAFAVNRRLRLHREEGADPGLHRRPAARGGH